MIYKINSLKKFCSIKLIFDFCEVAYAQQIKNNVSSWKNSKLKLNSDLCVHW